MKKFFLSAAAFTGSLLLLICMDLNAQNNGPERWEESISGFEKEDQANPPKEGAILFVGSSSIAKWQDIQDYFPEYRLLNRGFGGSQFEDLLFYADRVIYPYKPEKIFIYEGDNDIAAGDSPKKILEEAKKLRKMIARQLPDVPVVFISAKPSVARWNLKEQYEDLNSRLKKYAEKTALTEFADVWKPMLNENGEVNTHIFLEDNLHMNAQGYEIWQKALTPFLEAKPEGKIK